MLPRLWREGGESTTRLTGKKGRKDVRDEGMKEVLCPERLNL
jgi:hypothetical protein